MGKTVANDLVRLPGKPLSRAAAERPFRSPDEKEWSPWRRQGIVLVLTDGLGRVAFQQRDDAVLADGTPTWGLFGGWIEDSESPAAAALREVREELGCELDPDLLRPLGVHTYDGPGSDFDSYVFRYAVTTELDRAVLQEGLAWAFVEPVALRGRLLPNHEEIIDAFIAS